MESMNLNGNEKGSRILLLSDESTSSGAWYVVEVYKDIKGVLVYDKELSKVGLDTYDAMIEYCKLLAQSYEVIAKMGPNTLDLK
jgi:hypothetical protein